MHASPLRLFRPRILLAAAVIGLGSLGSATLHAATVTIEEMGVGANEIVNISSSTLGGSLWVYACEIAINANNTPTFGFCIDPWHWSSDGPMAYQSESLSSGPKFPGSMDALTALQIEQLWQEYFSPSISNENAAGLQIAIWDLVGASVAAQSNGANWFTLNSGNDFGAAAMIAWVQANPNATAANLVAVTGPGQDYVISASVLPQPPSATINAPAIAFTGSPLTVGSLATAPDNDLALHSIEWLSPTGAWTVNTTAAAGGSDSRTLGITFDATGLWTLRAGASTDGGATWYYSPSQQVMVTPAVTTYTLQTMAVPAATATHWYTPSPVVSRAYQIQHINQ